MFALPNFLNRTAESSPQMPEFQKECLKRCLSLPFAVSEKNEAYLYRNCSVVATWDEENGIKTRIVTLKYYDYVCKLSRAEVFGILNELGISVKKEIQTSIDRNLKYGLDILYFSQADNAPYVA